MNGVAPDVRLRLNERDARTVLLVQAVEDADVDGAVLSAVARAAATRRAFDEQSGSTDDPGRLRTRASLLRDDLLRSAPALQQLLDAREVPVGAGVVTLVVAAAAGAWTNAWGPERHVSVLAFPLAGLLAWNVAVYAAVVTRALAGGVSRLRRAVPGRRLAPLGRWLHRVWGSSLARRLGAGNRSATVVDAVHRFHRQWLAIAGPLIAARVRIILHLGALAMALGAIAGMYVSGIAFEYRATWESTWLDAQAVQTYLDVVLAPAAWVLGVRVPDVAPLRAPGGDGHAAPWIHLWGTTIGLFVVIPRAALALVDALTAARRARRLPVHLDTDYVRRALHSGRGAATLVEIVYYSCAPETYLRERLSAMLQEHVGARAVIRDGASVAYGSEPESIALPEQTSASRVMALVFTLAQTPEPEVHGDFIERLRDRLQRAGWQLLLVLDVATYRERVGSEERVRERRATWERLLRDLQLTAMELV